MTRTQPQRSRPAFEAAESLDVMLTDAGDGGPSRMLRPGAVATRTGQPTVHLNGACSGGMIGAAAVGHLAAEGRLGEIASLTLLVAALDNARAGTPSALVGRQTAAAVADSARRGYLDGKALSGVFTCGSRCGGGRQLRRGGIHRPHHSLGERLPQHPVAAPQRLGNAQRSLGMAPAPTSTKVEESTYVRRRASLCPPR